MAIILITALGKCGIFSEAFDPITSDVEKVSNEHAATAHLSTSKRLVGFIIESFDLAILENIEVEAEDSAGLKLEILLDTQNIELDTLCDQCLMEACQVLCKRLSQ